MPVISCHFSTLVSHKHIPISSHGRSRVQCYLLPVMCMSVRATESDKRENEKEKKKGKTWKCVTKKERREGRRIQPQLSHFLSDRRDITSGWMTLSAQSGRQHPYNTCPEDESRTCFEAGFALWWLEWSSMESWIVVMPSSPASFLRLEKQQLFRGVGTGPALVFAWDKLGEENR